MRRVQGVHFGVKKKEDNELKLSIREEVLSLYQDKLLPKSEVVRRMTEKHGCSRQYVYAILNEEAPKKSRKSPRKAVIDLFKGGATSREIQEETGYSRVYIKSILNGITVDESGNLRKANGSSLDAPQGVSAGYSVIFRKKVAELVLERGLTTYRVGKEFGIPVTTVSGWANKYDSFKDDQVEDISIREKIAVKQFMRLKESGIEKPKVGVIAERAGLSPQHTSKVLAKTGLRQRKKSLGKRKKSDIKAIEADIKKAFFTARHAMSDQDIAKKHGIPLKSVSAYRSAMKSEGRLY